MIYFETSALLKLYCRETDSEKYEAAFTAQTGGFTAGLAYAEFFWRLARKLREGEIDQKGYSTAAARFDGDWNEWYRVPLSMTVMKRARGLLEQYRLRASDAVHLASAASVASPGSVTFATADRRLIEAAASEGFHIL